MGKTKAKHGPNILKNPLEAFQGYGSDVVSSVAKNTTDEFDNLFSDLLGIKSSTEAEHEKQNAHGEVEVWSRSNENKTEVHARGHIEYHDEIRKSGEKALSSEHRQALQIIQEIRAEIQQLIKTSKVLEMEFVELAVEQTPTEVGEYHKGFYNLMMELLQAARRKVEDSGAWLSAVKGKNGKKSPDYWSMFKKHGTSFGMSSERSTATSVG
jgi:hypothetical protein